MALSKDNLQIGKKHDKEPNKELEIIRDKIYVVEDMAKES